MVEKFIKNKSIFGLVVVYGFILLSVGCADPNTQKNISPGSTDKIVSSPDSATNENVMKKYITDFLTEGYSKHYIINYINYEFRETKVKDAKIEAIIFTTMNYNFISFKQNPDTVPYIKKAKEKAQKETNPKTKEILQKEYEIMAKEHAKPFNSNYLFKLTGHLVNGKIDVKSISLFLEGDGPNGNGSIYTPAEKMLPIDAPQTIKPEGLIDQQPAQFAFVNKAKDDLDGDGIKEEINLAAFGEGGDFVLKAGRASVKGKLNQGGADGFVIVDIDKSDRYKEIAVHTPGPSSDDEFLVYGYDGTVFKEMGRLSRWPNFTGKGIVYVDNWMGFWNKTSKYVLTKQRDLKHVPQEFYSVNQEGTARESFILQKSRTEDIIVANLNKGSRMKIILCAPTSPNYYDDWFLIRSENNLLGWAKGKDIFERVDGLSFAD